MKMAPEHSCWLIITLYLRGKTFIVHSFTDLNLQDVLPFCNWTLVFGLQVFFLVIGWFKSPLVLFVLWLVLRWSSPVPMTTR